MSKHRSINVLTKPYLYDIGIKLSNLVNKPLNVGFLKTEVANLLFSLQVFTSKMSFFQLQK